MRKGGRRLVKEARMPRLPNRAGGGSRTRVQCMVRSESAHSFKLNRCRTPSTDVVGQLSLPLISHVTSEWPRRSLPSSASGGASGHGSQDGSRPSPCSTVEGGKRLH